MNKNVSRLAGCLVLAMTAEVAVAADYYVSSDGTWPSGAASDNQYKSIDTALWTSTARTTARVKAGDTVWVKDGFVCDSGTAGQIYSGCGYARIKLANVAFTLRSESGYVDESNGKGAYVRGGKSGSNAVRPIWSQNAKTVIQGLVIEDGQTAGARDQSSGGGVYGPATLRNCIVRNNTSVRYGGAFQNNGVVAYGCIISNCQSTATSTYGGGAVYGGSSYYDCQFIGNASGSYGGAICYNTTTATATYSPVYSNCVFRGNSAKSAGCASFVGDKKRATFIDCKILDNEANEDTGAVKGMATFVRCTIAGNTAGGNAGGVGATSDSVTADKMPELTDCVVSNNVAGGAGGGLYCGLSTGCTFVGNVAPSGGAALYAAEGGQSYYNCLFGGSRSDNGNIVEGNATTPLKFYNCTVAGNSSPKASCVNGVEFYNSIIWGNTFSGDELAACTAEYSCQKDLTEGEGNTNANPQLSPDYRLEKGSPCVDTAKYYDWMNTAGDARSFDAAGYPRIRGVSKATAKPDMGSYERACPGSLVIGR